jgi:signal peptidase II
MNRPTNESPPPETPPGPTFSLPAKLAWAFGVLVLDQWTKQLALQHVQGHPPRVYLGGIFRIEFAENPGAFLSLGAAMSPEMRFWVFVVTVGAFLVGAGWVLFRDRKLDRLSAFSLSVILGGGIGNLIDRSTRPNHGVVDFLNLGLGDFRTGIFNVADMAIMLGVILLAWQSLRSGRASETPSA